jgi:hypothetical protein
MNYWDIEPLTYWDNLLFTCDAPNEVKGWALRGHRKTEKTKGWFQMTILSQGCSSKEEAMEKAIEFTNIEISKDVLVKFET